MTFLGGGKRRTREGQEGEYRELNGQPNPIVPLSSSGCTQGGLEKNLKKCSLRGRDKKIAGVTGGNWTGITFP